LCVRRQCTGEISHSVDGQHCRFFKRRDQKTSSDVRLMMFDAMELSFHVVTIHANSLSELLLQAERFALSFQSIQDGRQAMANALQQNRHVSAGWLLDRTRSPHDPRRLPSDLLVADTSEWIQREIRPNV
jgi:hypothetical protein